jgi:hypothetical protein
MNPFSLMRKLLLGATLVVLTASCDPSRFFGAEGCTLIGCDSGVSVRLSSQPVGAIKIEVFEGPPTSNIVAYVYECVANCLKEVKFRGFTPDHPYVRITYGGVTQVTDVPSVTYTISRPNGPKCGPECKQGTVDVPLPSAVAALREDVGD